MPISDIVALTGLDLGPLIAADRLQVPTSADARERKQWVRLDNPAAIQL